ncbi:Ethyl tert-butyl ether degradation EthD [Botryosphaeria dothidea]|uniref:Ethyl tert-butyl ether degradation EthD n=1 Tax=Botryosphaeria dothidea TaxID=55169 RepID=A0A8H4N0D7_9PEZI|nr:Ethyl tert-butyl ether degradation EthD [Botryosphaeria dothidea]
MDHYTNVHLPMIEQYFPGKLLKWEVTTLPEDAQFMVLSRVEWTSEEDFNSLHSCEDGKKIFADVPNFATGPPLFLKETPFASSS